MLVQLKFPLSWNVGIIVSVVAVIAIIGVVIASATPMLAGGIPFAL